jgi:AraC family transcriptional regulator
MQESAGLTSIAPGVSEVLHSSAIAKQISPLPQAMLRRVREYMEARLENNLSLDQLARETHYSRGHFLRMFRAATGMTPHLYLTKRRIERAKRMLRDEEEASLIDVAALCGFSSQSHMTRVFRERIGVTPSAFRRRPELKSVV